MNGAVPHSGNKCSGLCRPPCDHPDCWQCAEGRSRAQDMAAAQRLMAMTKAAEKAGATSVLGAMAGQKPEDWQKATVTRGALEALAQKAGVRMDWNNGSPVFYDDAVHEMERRYMAAERSAMEEKVKELERIAAQQRGGLISQQAARSLAEAAGQTMDTMVSDIIKQKVEATLREDMVANEAAVKGKFKQAGASDDDIAAVEKLLGGSVAKPKEAKPFAYDSSSVLTMADLQRAMDQIRAAGAPDPVTWIVHPDMAIEMSVPGNRGGKTIKLGTLSPLP